MIQSKLKELKNLKEIGGLPSKKIREKKYNPNGIPTNNSENRLNHTLRDIEYTTNLSDRIFELKSVLDKFSNSLHNYIIKFFIDEITNAKLNAEIMNKIQKMKPNQDISLIEMEDLFPQEIKILLRGQNYFKILKENNLSKYKQAVKDLYKAINF